MLPRLEMLLLTHVPSSRFEARKQACKQPCFQDSSFNLRQTTENLAFPSAALCLLRIHFCFLLIVELVHPQPQPHPQAQPTFSALSHPLSTRPSLPKPRPQAHHARALLAPGLALALVESRSPSHQLHAHTACFRRPLSSCRSLVSQSERHSESRLLSCLLTFCKGVLLCPPPSLNLTAFVSVSVFVLLRQWRWGLGSQEPKTPKP